MKKKKINKKHEDIQKQAAQEEKERKRRERMEWGGKSIFEDHAPFHCIICDEYSLSMMYGQWLVCSWPCFLVEFSQRKKVYLKEKKKYKEEDLSHNHESELYFDTSDEQPESAQGI